jgi:hypothetical protein
MADDGWQASPGCDRHTGKDPWEPADPLGGMQPPRDRTPLLGEEKDDYGNVLSTNAVSGLLDQGYIDCPKCHSSWHLSNLPHDCRDTALRKLLADIARDADDSYNEHSEMLGKHDEWLTMMGRALAEHLHDHRQVEMTFDDELVQQAFSDLAAKVVQAEAKADEYTGLIAKSQKECERLWNTLDNMKAEREHTEKLQKELAQQLDELRKYQNDLRTEIKALKAENAILTERVKDAEGGLFG